MPKAKYSRDTRGRSKGHRVAPAKMDDKQRHARFGKKSKKGDLAETANYVTRTQAVKRLQVTLRDFRRLCILKGIYPRHPPKNPTGSSQRQTYYHVKDIGYLAHEPVLAKFRDLKAFMKKVRRAAGKDELSEARRLAANRPVYRIDHLVRERYPRFLDALADIDDALSMAHLFAGLPADKPVEAERVSTATRLVREWQHIVVRARALRKGFISVKGYYFQASFHGVPVTWTMPHRFPTVRPGDVDYRILLTFFELYEVQLKHVFFKLYADHGLAYPPTLDEGADTAGVMLGAVRSSRLDRGAMAAAASADAGAETPAKRARAEDVSDAAAAREAQVVTAAKQGMGAVLREAAESGGVDGAGIKTLAGTAGAAAEEEDDDDSVAGSVGSLDADDDGELDAEAEELGRAMVPEVEGEEEEEEEGAAAKAAEARRAAMLAERRGRRLFRGCVVFLNREVPREPFELVVRAFAGRVGWDGPGSPYPVDDERITHHIIDRPAVRAPIPGREYAQPQWVFDSANTRVLLPMERYRPGEALPPHLSPFVEDEKEGYVPEYRRALDKLRSAVEVREAGAEGAPGGGEEEDGDGEEVDSDEEEEEAVAAAEALMARGFLGARPEEDDDEDDEDGLEGDSSDEEEEEGEDDEDEDDEEAASSSSSSSSSSSTRAPAPAPTAASKSRDKRAKTRAKAAEEERRRKEDVEMKAMMLSNRKRREVQKVMRGQGKQSAWVRRMEAKRDAIEAGDEVKAAPSKPTRKAGKKAGGAKRSAKRARE